MVAPRISTNALMRILVCLCTVSFIACSPSSPCAASDCAGCCSPEGVCAPCPDDAGEGGGGQAGSAGGGATGGGAAGAGGGAGSGGGGGGGGGAAGGRA